MTIVQAPFSLTDAQLSDYNTHGYVVVRGLFAPEEIEPFRQACEADPALYNTQSELEHGDGTSIKISYWNELGDSLLGVMPRVSRLVNSVETIMDEQCYHWHSKVVLKKPGEGRVPWHQGFGAWYQDGCLSPKLVSCGIALTDHTRENGCLQIIKGSHHLGRVDHGLLPGSNSIWADAERMKAILNRLEVVYCELQRGDAVFLHANSLHGSDINQTDKIRTFLFSTYNAASNEPYDLTNQMHHCYVPLEKLPDSVLLNRQYDGVFETQKFFDVETENDSKIGVSIRS